ncbi:MAG: DUF3343 domain-containing protein [Clostridia bacterium]|nr:DUF3343 domain-containing protein [Clostridia bacterium]
MKYCYAIFRSKTQAINFVEVLNKNGVPSKIVSTPKEANMGCGISATFSLYYLDFAKGIISKNNFDSFKKFIIVEKNGLRTSTRTI